MNTFKLSGGNYGGYVLEKGKAVLYSEDGEKLDSIAIKEVGEVTINQVVYTNVIDVNSFLYSLDVSENNGQYDFIGMTI